MNPIRSANLFDLPSNVLLTILAKWLYIQDVCKIDSALLCSSNAPQFPTRQALLSILCSPHIRFSCFVSTIRVDIYSFLRWVDLRKVSIEHQLCIKNSYKHICKRVPSLCDVVGSVDHSTPRTSKTEEATGGVFNYTADSIKNILLAMQLPQGGLRFLDAGCGNAIFATLIQMSFPSAEVSENVPIYYLYQVLFTGICFT